MEKPTVASFRLTTRNRKLLFYFVLCRLFVHLCVCNTDFHIEHNKFDRVTFSFSLLALLFVRVLSTMSTLSFVVELDSFQHSEEDFVLKCLAASCGRLRTTYFHLFDTTSLLSRGSATLPAYQYQTRHHGLALASVGLPQAMACSVLMHAVLKDFMDLSERGDLAPTQVIMWVKGTQKTALVTRLVNTPGLPCPFLVRNLMDVGCPKEKELEPADPGLLLTQEKAQLFSAWLMTEGLDCDPVGRHTL